MWDCGFFATYMHRSLFSFFMAYEQLLLIWALIFHPADGRAEALFRSLNKHLFISFSCQAKCYVHG